MANQRLRREKKQVTLGKRKRVSSDAVSGVVVDPPDNDRYEPPAYLRAWINAKTPNTRLSYIHTLTMLRAHFLQRMPRGEGFNMLTLEYPDLAEFIDTRKQAGNKPATLRKHTIFLKAMYGFLMDQELIDLNPAKSLAPVSVSRSVVERILTKPERQRIVEAAVRPVLALILRVLYSMGLRIGECLDLLKTHLGEALVNG